jgi:penicillin-binding protein 1C
VGSNKNFHENHKLNTRSFLSLLTTVFSFIGRPFYTVFVYLILSSVITISYISKTVCKYYPKYIRIITNRISLLKTKVKIVAQRILLHSRLLFLKLNLLFVTKKALKKKRLTRYKKFSFVNSLLVGSLIITIGLIINALIVGSLFWHFILKDLPDPIALSTRPIHASTKIYDRSGVLLYTIFKDENRTPIKLSDLPPHVVNATIAVEDFEFYKHHGYSLRGIIRSFVDNQQHKRLSGGSTITQQLIKNTLLTSEKTYTRKLKEVVLAMLVEKQFNKDEILEMYINEVAYGGTAYGIQEAAQIYFDKDAKDLSVAEAALLAGLPKSPTSLSPFIGDKDASIARKNTVLDLMYMHKFLTTEEYNTAINTQITFATNYAEEIIAPHFVFYIKELLKTTYSEKAIETGGMHIVTSLDYELQQKVERIVAEEITKLKNLSVGNAAVVVLHPQTGEILAMVGSKDYFDEGNDGNVNVTTMPRQPGSSIKVVTYAYALSHGNTLASIVTDAPITYNLAGSPPYTPKNYEGGYRGNMTIRAALAQSRNIPAVKTMAAFGVNNIIGLGRSMGITTWDDESRFGLSLTLGGGETRLLDMARVYATLANYGVRPPLTPILSLSVHTEDEIVQIPCVAISPKVASTKKQIVESTFATGSADLAQPESNYSCTEETVLDKRVAYLITNVLTDNAARTPTFGANSLLVIPGHPEVAVKTGTSNNLKDNLAIGYTKDFVVAVWVGNNDNTPMNRIASGVTGATPIFHRVMYELLQNKDSYEWEVPQDMVRVSVCTNTGTLACAGCPTKQEWFLAGTEPTKHCEIKKEEKNEEPKIDTTVTPTKSPIPTSSQQPQRRNRRNR